MRDMGKKNRTKTHLGLLATVAKDHISPPKASGRFRGIAAVARVPVRAG
jgi:hypothetical protein